MACAVKDDVIRQELMTSAYTLVSRPYVRASRMITSTKMIIDTLPVRTSNARPTQTPHHDFGSTPTSSTPYAERSMQLVDAAPREGRSAGNGGECGQLTVAESGRQVNMSLN